MEETKAFWSVAVREKFIVGARDPMVLLDSAHFKISLNQRKFKLQMKLELNKLIVGANMPSYSILWVTFTLWALTSVASWGLVMSTPPT